MDSWIDNLTVECRNGDIFSMSCEALACNVDVALRMNHRLGRQLLERGGLQVKNFISTVISDLPGGKLRLGDAIGVPLPATLAPLKWAVLCAWWDRDNDYTRSLISMCLISTLRQAFRLHLKSVAIPLIGTGSGLVSPKFLGSVILASLSDLDGLKNSGAFSVERITFCSDRPGHVEELRQVLIAGGLC